MLDFFLLPANRNWTGAMFRGDGRRVTFHFHDRTIEVQDSRRHAELNRQPRTQWAVLLSFVTPLRGLAAALQRQGGFLESAGKALERLGAEAEGLEGDLDIAGDGLGDAERVAEGGQRDFGGLEARGITREGGLAVSHGVAAQLAQAVEGHG